jgi:arylsulfatase B
MLTDEAVDWIRDRHAKSPDQPWLVVASYTAPHTPLEAPPEEIEAVAPLENARRRTYVAMVQNLDRNIGRLMETLDDTRERQNTLIIFLSDNGGATDNASWNGRLSGAKGSCLEGGIRVPMIWNWPAQIPSGQRSEGVVSSLDIVPTVVAAAGAALLAPQATPPHQDIKNVQRYSARYGEYDGQNVMPELSGQSEPQSRTLYWRLQGQAALLDGTHKLVRPHHRLPQLFRPATDPGESQDLAADQAERSAELLRQLAEWEATLPTVPLWDSSPYWWGESAKIFDRYAPKPEPR